MIELILECMLLGVIAAFIGIFYNFTLDDGEILGKFGDFLMRWSDKRQFILKRWISKSLGACVYCNTTWIALFILTAYWTSWHELPNIYCVVICSLSTIGTQHILVTIIFNKFRRYVF